MEIKLFPAFAGSIKFHFDPEFRRWVNIPIPSLTRLTRKVRPARWKLIEKKTHENDFVIFPESTQHVHQLSYLAYSYSIL